MDVKLIVVWSGRNKPRITRKVRPAIIEQAGAIYEVGVAFTGPRGTSMVERRFLTPSSLARASIYQSVPRSTACATRTPPIAIATTRWAIEKLVTELECGNVLPDD